jgi:predicted O-methyltransferase YrrM
MAPKVTAITTFNRKGLEQYGRSAISSFLQHWPSEVDLVVYSEGFDLEPAQRIRSISLNEAAPRLVTFKNHYSKQPMAAGHTKTGYDYNFDAVRFAHKMFAMFAAAGTLETDYLVWLDGDVVTQADVPESFIPRIMQGVFAAYLGRKGMHSETGFLCFDLRHPEAKPFFETMERIYLTGELFKLNAWHDCEVFDVTRTVFEAQGKIRTRDLSADLETLDPFSESCLSAYMSHFKGQPKTEDGAEDQGSIETLNNPRRYEQILRLIDAFKPETIVEVGTWNGRRAIEMARQGLRRRDRIHYTGYDLFDDATPENDSEELNGKSPVTLAAVDAALAAFETANPGFSYRLVRGNSIATLEAQHADFCFIDGGHACETISHDFSKLKGSDIVVFDDYYLDGADTGAFGCNKLLETIPHLVLPVTDRFSNGLAIALAVTATPAKLAEIKSLFPHASGRSV